ncbi:hypothetical protein PAGU2638_10460 [Lysobacter sp. PAGU 2638]
MRSAFLVVFLAGTATGCASMHDSSAAYVPAPSHSVATVQQDDEYIARVEQQARIHGAGVTWINPPIKHRHPTPR